MSNNKFYVVVSPISKASVLSRGDIVQFPEMGNECLSPEGAGLCECPFSEAEAHLVPAKDLDWQDSLGNLVPFKQTKGFMRNHKPVLPPITLP